MLCAQIIELAGLAKTPLGSSFGQLLARLLPHLQLRAAAELVSWLSDDLKAEIALCLATMDRVELEGRGRMSETLRQRLRQNSAQKGCLQNVESLLARILESIDPGTSQALLEVIEDFDAALAGEVTRLRFTFDDLARLEDRSLQRVLREVSPEDLALALSDADDSLKGRVFANQSARARQMLWDEIAAIGTSEARFANAARQRIAQTVRRLEEAEEIVISASPEKSTPSVPVVTPAEEKTPPAAASRPRKRGPRSARALRPAKALAD